MLRCGNFGIWNTNFNYAHSAPPVGPDVSQTLETLNSLQIQMSFFAIVIRFCWVNESLIIDNALFGANIKKKLEILSIFDVILV